MKAADDGEIEFLSFDAESLSGSRRLAGSGRHIGDDRVAAGMQDECDRVRRLMRSDGDDDGLGGTAFAPGEEFP